MLPQERRRACHVEVDCKGASESWDRGIRGTEENGESSKPEEATLHVGNVMGKRRDNLINLKLKGVNYGIKFFPKSCWCHIWKPKWHEGRGRYVTIGLWVIAIYRGY